jgi:hypothetical protein
MTDPFKVEFRGDHVCVELDREFEVSVERREQLWSVLRSICDEHGTRRVLVEGFVPGGERDTSEIIDAGKKTATVPDLWLAFHFEGFIANEQTELFEAIAASQGVRVKFFADAELALKWLRTNSPR